MSVEGSSSERRGDGGSRSSRRCSCSCRSRLSGVGFSVGTHDDEVFSCVDGDCDGVDYLSFSLLYVFFPIYFPSLIPYFSLSQVSSPFNSSFSLAVGLNFFFSSCYSCLAVPSSCRSVYLPSLSVCFFLSLCVLGPPWYRRGREVSLGTQVQ